MFEVRYLVNDNKLGRSLWALDGLAVGKPEVVPIRGAQIINGEVREVEEAPPIEVQKAPRKRGASAKGGNGKGAATKKPIEESIPGKAALWLREKGITKLNPGGLAEAIEKVGGNPTSVWYAKNYLVAHKLLVANPDGKTYTLKAEGLKEGA